MGGEKWRGAGRMYMASQPRRPSAKLRVLRLCTVCTILQNNQLTGTMDTLGVIGVQEARRRSVRKPGRRYRIGWASCPTGSERRRSTLPERWRWPRRRRATGVRLSPDEYSLAYNKRFLRVSSNPEYTLARPATRRIFQFQRKIITRGMRRLRGRST